ncbi:SGNH/GDSL hydrolase family protein [Calderihabitans maritimus]|uniref:G-D-S-L family lipolytic protein n=1 Tax=Calderihabitans maritimus TaxID=1246530 RepID=A0A1Z5HPK4_9FIRM|nr:SGNH/GDSL hydrolase family protein [Calderihabitans maritimus]GAW91453.1 G-D-S-L family lipolytic protein [Calderihabitans maritimus]
MDSPIKKVVCLGDSITYGYPFGPSWSWVYLTEKKTGIPMENRGINGDTTEDMLRRFDKHVTEANPSHVILLGGTNDAAVGRNLNYILGNFCRLVSKARENNIQPILGLLVPSLDLFLEAQLQKIRHRLRDYARQEGLVIIDFFSALLNEGTGKAEERYFIDDVHPSREGYQAMAQVAADTLREIGQTARHQLL